MQLSKNKSVLIIDDNRDWLEQLELYGFQTLCTKGFNKEEILNKAKCVTKVSFIYINICLIYNGVSERLQYGGTDLLIELLFEFQPKGWKLLTFENEEQIFNYSKNLVLQTLKNVSICDYLTFINKIHI